MHKQGLNKEMIYAEAFDDSLDYRIYFYLDSLTVHVWEMKRRYKRPLSYYFATVRSVKDTLFLDFKENNFPIAIPSELIIDPKKKAIFCISKRTNKRFDITIDRTLNSNLIFGLKDSTAR